MSKRLALQSNMKWFYVLVIFLVALEVQSEELKPVGMTKIPSGEYTPMYTQKNKKIKVTSFLLDMSPVTNKEFLDFVKNNSQWRRSKIKKIFSERSYLESWKNDLSPSSRESFQKPVVQVSWFAAQAYCESHGKSLPTVDQWEYVAKNKLMEWNAPTDLQEWTLDFNTAMVTGESRGDTALERNLFCGSGSLGTSDFKDYAAFMRFAYRSSLKAQYSTSNLGFRCAKSEDSHE